MNVVIYTRYSSDNQREESIGGQLRECKEYVDRNDMAVVGSYIDRVHYKHILKKNGVKVISAEEHISESPEGIPLSLNKIKISQVRFDKSYLTNFRISLCNGLSKNQVGINGFCLPIADVVHFLPHALKAVNTELIQMYWNVGEVHFRSVRQLRFR